MKTVSHDESGLNTGITILLLCFLLGTYRQHRNKNKTSTAIADTELLLQYLVLLRIS